MLDYENLAELYDPITSDPVKYTYHAETTGELLDYFRVWAIQLVKHPANAVEATMNNAYGWFYQEGYTQKMCIRDSYALCVMRNWLVTIVHWIRRRER